MHRKRKLRDLRLLALQTRPPRMFDLQEDSVLDNAEST